MLPASLQKNDSKARILIAVFSVVVFVAVVALSRIRIQADLGFDIHLFAKANAVINSVIALLLVAALVAVKNGRYRLHRQMMMAALVLSILFLVSYIAHHLFAGDTRFGDINHDGLLDEAEKAATGSMRYLYMAVLVTHIFLAALILPFILFTAYRALTAEYPAHKKLAKITWPLWLYVAVTGPVVYLMISPYYS